jgi:chromosome segregation ATPase
MVALTLGVLALGQALAQALAQQSEVDRLKSELEAKNVQLLQVQAEVSKLKAQLEQFNAQVKGQTSKLSTRLGELSGFLETDRALLLELRKNLPEGRGEAETYLERLQALALKSDPSRLGNVVRRLKESAPAFLNWRDKQYGTQEEAAQAFVQSGAQAFRGAMSNFNEAILLSVVNHIEALLDVLDSLK